MFYTLFQYISCYCLSIWTQQRHLLLHISIHLMLLFIQAPIVMHCLSKNFNTSHVTVYHSVAVEPLLNTKISIHLMLLFIDVVYQSSVISPHFNTSHVTVYQVLKRAI